MRQHRDPIVGRAAVQVGGRPLGRLEPILVGSLDAADERHRHLVLTRGDKDWLRPVRIRRSSLVLHHQERHWLVGDRDVYVVKARRPRTEVGLQLEDVLSVRGKVVRHDHATTGTERRAFHTVPSVLRDLSRIPVLRHGRNRLGIPDGQPTDLAGGPQIRIQEGRREPLPRGRVVERGHEKVSGEPLARVNLQVQEV